MTTSRSASSGKPQKWEADFADLVADSNSAIGPTTTADAWEFGVHARQGGWRLGLLVARNVRPGVGVGGNASVVRATDDGKISARAFARSAETSADRVIRHLNAWQAAAMAGEVPSAEQLTPGAEVDLDVEALPEWSSFLTPQRRTRSEAAGDARSSGTNGEVMPERMAPDEGIQDDRTPSAATLSDLTTGLDDQLEEPGFVVSEVSSVDDRRGEDLRAGWRYLTKGLLRLEAHLPLSEAEKAERVNLRERILQLWGSDGTESTTT